MMSTSCSRICLVLALLLILNGCGALSGEIIVSTDYPAKKKRVNAPSKKVPKSDRVPATQNPYKIKGKTYYPLPSSEGFTQTGVASWYGKDFHGRKTSNGETYNMWGMTAAHKTLPMNTYLLVENLENDKKITVRVNDRGPFSKRRILDLTKQGAAKLGYVNQGTARVRITALAEAVTYRHGDVSTERFKEHPDFKTGEFYIQIGSFTNADNATRLKDKIQSWGKKSVIQKFDRGDRIFYRVQVKAGNTLSGAEHVEKVMNKSGYPGAFIVAR